MKKVPWLLLLVAIAIAAALVFPVGAFAVDYSINISAVSVLYHFQGILVHPAQRHTPVCWGVTAGCTSIYQIWYNRLLLFSPVTRDRYQTRDGQSASARAMREGAFPGDDAGEISLHCPGCGGPALCSARWCDSLEESDDGFCEDVIAITGNHVGSICHVHILGVRALFEETLGPCLT